MFGMGFAEMLIIAIMAILSLGPDKLPETMVEIAKFFRSQQSPIDPSETIQLYAFMQAAATSKARGGAPVKIAEVMEQAERKADELLKGQLQRP